MVFCHFLAIVFGSFGKAGVDSQVGSYGALGLSSSSIDFVFLILYMLFHVTIIEICDKFLISKIG